MSVTPLPTMHVPAPRPPLPKIALEEAFAHKQAMPLDKDGNPDFAWHKKDNAMNQQYIDAVAPRLFDFEETRLPAMDEAGIQFAVNSLTCPGIERILDPAEAHDAATAANDSGPRRSAYTPTVSAGSPVSPCMIRRRGPRSWSAA